MKITSRVKQLEKKLLGNQEIWAVFKIGYYEDTHKRKAAEGALASLKYGFEELFLNEVVSFTAVQNMRSRAVMGRIGMHHDPNDDFDHTKLSPGHPLQRHVLYRIKRVEWDYSKQKNMKS